MFEMDCKDDKKSERRMRKWCLIGGFGRCRIASRDRKDGLELGREWRQCFYVGRML